MKIIASLGIAGHGFRWLGLLSVLGVFTCGSFGQTGRPVIALAKGDAAAVRMENLPESEQRLLATMPANFHHFGAVKVGDLTNAQRLTLEFGALTKITKIASTADFKVVEGGTCAVERMYEANTSCELLVQFTPRGPGHRMGKLTVTHTGSAQPTILGLVGFATTPAVSFTPALISTVAATFPGNVGLLNGAQNLTIDSGDALYVADTGNNVIRWLDSSGVIRTISQGALSAPLGVAVDGFGDVYFDEPAANKVFVIFNYGSQLQINGTGSDSCTVAAPCKMPNEATSSPGQMSMDRSNNLFFAEGSQGAVFSVALPYPPTLARIYDPFTYQESYPDAFAVDASDNLYSFWNTNGICQLVSQSFYNSANAIGVYSKVAGGRACGFSGDGGQAAGAEIGTKVGQIAFDLAGNLYFTDTVNNRVRRIDAGTGIIRTIAGNGTTGNKGDTGPATLASVGTPTGVGVDSQGLVYIISAATATGTAQVVRKVGANGALNFGSQKQGTASAVQTVTVSNTGNEALKVTNVVMTGTNPGDFSIDPASTSCDFSAGNYLYAGQSCQYGVIFKPAALGARQAFITLTDNTVASINKVRLGGVGATTAAFKITAPGAGASLATGAKVKFSTSVTSASGPAPTGKVTFKVDGAQVGGAVMVVAGAASVTLPSLGTGTHALAANYSGDRNYVAGKATEKITVK